VYSSWIVGNWEVDFRLARRSEANARDSVGFHQSVRC
jgi:hypothetical protein